MVTDALIFITTELRVLNVLKQKGNNVKNMKKAKIIEKVKEWVKTTDCGCCDYDDCPYVATKISCAECHSNSLAQFLQGLLPEDEESEET